MTPAPTAASVIARSGDCRITHMMLMIRLLAINRMAATNRFLHRNTLVYRLEKIQKSTGLDIRVFDDALTFKIALMVSSYMEFMKKQD